MSRGACRVCEAMRVRTGAQKGVRAQGDGVCLACTARMPLPPHHAGVVMCAPRPPSDWHDAYGILMGPFNSQGHAPGGRAP